MLTVWNIPDIADSISSGLRLAAAAIDAEHAVYGLDSLNELALHPVLARALSEAGFGVFREQRYPSDQLRRRLSEGERCDFVLTRDAQPLRRPESAGTLFDPTDAVALEDAFWLEVKVVAQFTTEGPNTQYSSQLLSTVRQDVTKLSRDPGILHAGLLLVMFVRDQRVAEHDLRIWQDRCLERGLPIGAPSHRHLPLNDRMGNGICWIAVYPVSHL